MKPIPWILTGIGAVAVVTFLLRYEIDISLSNHAYASEPDRQMIGGNIGVRLERTKRAAPSRDYALWIAIRNRTDSI
jgi:hypothetical protein